ncbi:MAG TPA: hypothetical protein VJ553_07170 [Candidatus Paceibacterota bacterium]|nr:hypothetical protein [Candidatus Paceibacterota bacterium]
MRPLWKRWPTVLATLFFILNVDFVVMPVLAWLGVRGWTLFWAAACCATAEPVYWNWYAKWVVLNVTRSERARHLAREFREQGLAGQFRAMWQTVREFLEDKFDWFVENARIHANGGQANEQLREAAIALIRGTHRLMMYPMMLVLGCTPGGWPVAIFLRRIFPVPGGFVVFLATNAVKTYALGLVYLWLPWWGKILTVLGAILFLFFSTRKVVRKVNTLHQSARKGLP